jgi:hypothetical protein
LYNVASRWLYLKEYINDARYHERQIHNCSMSGQSGFTEVLEARCLLLFEKVAVIFLRIYSISHLTIETHTQRKARELISSASPAAKTRHFSFNRTQSRVVIGHLTGHKTLRRYLHLTGLTNSPLCRRCGAEYETSAHILCECEALASLRHVYLGSFFLDPEDIKSLHLGVI